MRESIQLKEKDKEGRHCWERIGSAFGSVSAENIFRLDYFHSIHIESKQNYAFRRRKNGQNNCLDHQPVIFFFPVLFVK